MMTVRKTTRNDVAEGSRCIASIAWQCDECRHKRVCKWVDQLSPESNLSLLGPLSNYPFEVAVKCAEFEGITYAENLLNLDIERVEETDSKGVDSADELSEVQ